jgi:hypothetical protein
MNSSSQKERGGWCSWCDVMQVHATLLATTGTSRARFRPARDSMAAWVPQTGEQPCQGRQSEQHMW